MEFLGTTFMHLRWFFRAMRALAFLPLLSIKYSIVGSPVVDVFAIIFNPLRMFLTIQHLKVNSNQLFAEPLFRHLFFLLIFHFQNFISSTFLKILYFQDFIQEPQPLSKNSTQASVNKTTSNCFLFVFIKKLTSSFFFLISWIP